MAYTMLAIGPANPDADTAWLKTAAITRVVRQPSKAVGGKRLNKRMLGIGVDSLFLALRTLAPGVRGPYLANNPWIGAALRLTGRKNFVVTGIYAEPRSRSWRVLQSLIGHTEVITLSESEANAWVADGGKAAPVLYGNTFRYPAKIASDEFHIFVGGSSDRDESLISRLESEVLQSDGGVRLTLAVGGQTGIIEVNGNVVERTGTLSQKEFGQLLSTASVAFIPIKNGIRAAGHMVMVGALECGIPVLMTPAMGLREYFVSPAVSALNPDESILPQLRLLADEPENESERIRGTWKQVFSLDAYTQRVASLIAKESRLDS